jgi:flagellar biosynthesis anti-sigma factor FlgM
MKIDNRNDLAAVSTPGAKGAASVEGGVRRGADSKAGSAGPDHAELSGLAGKIAEASNRDGAARAANVEQLRAQVAKGSYHPDPAAISHGVVEDALSNAAAAGGSSKK